MDHTNLNYEVSDGELVIYHHGRPEDAVALVFDGGIADCGEYGVLVKTDAGYRLDRNDGSSVEVQEINRY